MKASGQGKLSCFFLDVLVQSGLEKDDAQIDSLRLCLVPREF